jgi:DNA-binding MarR family transcriptional regulator
MSENAKRHAELAAEINAVMPEFVTRTVMFHQAVAQAVGLNVTDLHCLNLLLLEGPMTPGQLARNSGLTAGAAITGAIDRLERLGYVQRRNDPSDRRKVLVHPNRDKVGEKIAPLYDGIARWHQGELSQRDSDQLAVILDYLTSATEGTRAATRLLRHKEGGRAGCV